MAFGTHLALTISLVAIASVSAQVPYIGK
jgi:hypothetical protein